MTEKESSSPGPIVLVGDAEDEHVSALRRALLERSADVHLLDSLRFPEKTRLLLGARPDRILADGRDVGRPSAVYVRSLYASPLAFGVDAAEEMKRDWKTTMVVFREKAEILVSILKRWELAGVPLYNSLGATEAARKPFQLSLFESEGLPVPKTIWTNDPEAVREFAGKHRVAYKPVGGGAATRELVPEDLAERRLSRLSNAAVTFQELLPGPDVRVFVLDGRIAGAFRIESSALDYRQHEESVEPTQLDSAVERCCLRAAELLGLRFTGIDLKGGADGRYRILEANPSPMFLGFDRITGSDLLGQLASALLSPARPPGPPPARGPAS